MHPRIEDYALIGDEQTAALVGTVDAIREELGHGGLLRCHDTDDTTVDDAGLLAEEYDPVAGRQLGSFHQAFSHIALVSTALALFGGDGAG